VRNDEQMNGISMDDPSDIDSEIKPLKRGNVHIWQIASIYGANASGKSTFLRALGSMFYNIADTRHNLVGERFLFDYSLKEEPIYCEMCFSLLKPGSKAKYNEYRYGYKLGTYIKNDDIEDEEEYEKDGKANEVLSEWLTIRDINSNDEPMFVFNRERDSLEFFGVHKNSPTAKQLSEKFDELEMKTTLVMRLVGNLNMNDDDNLFSSIHAWCRKAVPIEFFSETEGRWHLNSAAARIMKNERNFKDRFLKFIQKFDRCIFDVKVKSENEKYELQIGHKIKNTSQDQIYYRSIYKESYGTQKIAGMCPYFLDAIENGGLLMIDEIDIKLHPMVILDLIEECHKNENIQVIFSTHNLVTLDKRYMHMDEIWFVEKFDDERSSIACLDKASLVADELKPEFVDYWKLYLNNRFGAVPSQKLVAQRSDDKRSDDN